MLDHFEQLDEDDCLEEEMMFEFEQHVERLPLFQRSVESPERELLFDEDRRPPNPMAYVLQSSEGDPISDALNAPPSLQAPPAMGIFGWEEPPIPACFNGRKKRKYTDAVGTDSDDMRRCVRPRALRAACFTQDGNKRLPNLTKASPISADAFVSLDSIKSTCSLPRSDSINIPLSSKPVVLFSSLKCSWSPKALSSQPSTSWSAAASSSFEYFCRHSLDISSPLRMRFRDMMVGSVGSTGSFNS